MIATRLTVRDACYSKASIGSPPPNLELVTGHRVARLIEAGEHDAADTWPPAALAGWEDMCVVPACGPRRTGLSDARRGGAFCS